MASIKPQDPPDPQKPEPKEVSAPVPAPREDSKETRIFSDFASI